MTGPEHFRKAERLLTEANHIMDGFPGEQYAQTIATAQVHATLALAAATALNTPDGGPSTEDWDAWVEAASAYKRSNTPVVTG